MGTFTEQARVNSKIAHSQKRLNNIAKYNLNPKLCNNCGSAIEYDKKINNFCGSSCACKFNNKKRTDNGWKPSKVHRLKVSRSLMMKEGAAKPTTRTRNNVAPVRTEPTPINQPNTLLNSDELQRFEEKFIKCGKDECWEWVASTSTDGYGAIHIKRLAKGKISGGYVRASRLSKAHYEGHDLYSDRIACHKCDNPLCVNPNHIWMGTYSENAKDMIFKNRHKNVIFRGEDNFNAKITSDNVIEIRKLLELGNHTQSDIADMFGITPTSVSSIWRKKKWKHI